MNYLPLFIERRKQFSGHMIAETSHAQRKHPQKKCFVHFSVPSFSSNNAHLDTEHALQEIGRYSGCSIVIGKPGACSSVPGLWNFHEHHDHGHFQAQNSGICISVPVLTWAYKMHLYCSSWDTKAADFAGQLKNAFYHSLHTLIIIVSASNAIQTVLGLDLRLISNCMHTFGFSA